MIPVASSFVFMLLCGLIAKNLSARFVLHFMEKVACFISFV